MAKKSQRRLSRQERDSAGCISGLISIFDFRHGRSTKRLLADRRRVSKPAVGKCSMRIANASYVISETKFRLKVFKHPNPFPLCSAGGGHLSNHTILLGPNGESKTVEVCCTYLQ